MFTLLCAGDFAPCGDYEALVLRNGADVFGDLQTDIGAADLAFVNLESPLCHADVGIRKSGPHLKAHPDCVKTLAETGFEVVGLANNHIMDFGRSGLEETISACQKAGMAICGAGTDLREAQLPLLKEKKGMRVAFVAVAEQEFSIAAPDKPGAAPLDAIDNTRQIEAVRKEADLVFVMVHGGNEYFPYPRPGLRKICKFLIDRGVDAVICHHPHVPGAYEFYMGKPIIYSLGNLIFDHAKPSKGWCEGYAVRLEYDTHTKKLAAYEIIPYTQSVHQGGVRKMQDQEKASFLQRLTEYGRVLADDEAYAREWTDFCKYKEGSIILSMFLPLNLRIFRKINKIIPLKKWILPKSSIPAKKNMIKCESHRELLIDLLEKKI